MRKLLAAALVLSVCSCRSACSSGGTTEVAGPPVPPSTPNHWLATANPAVPDTVYLTEMTWPELHAAMAAGKTTVIVPTGGVEQNGPHMVLGKHNTIVRHTAGEIARELGDTLVAPVVTYVPEGDPATREGHMAFPGTMSLPDDVFEEVLEAAARSLAAHGFRTICLLGDSGGNQEPQARVAARLSAAWSGTGVRVIHVSEYYGANQAEVAWLREHGESMPSIGTHAGIRDTSELLAVDPKGVHEERRAPNGGGNPNETGVYGDPSRASAERGETFLRMKIDAAVRQIRSARADPD